MTTTHADQALPSADFPVTWDDPAQEQASWFQDVMHNPLPVTPLTATFFHPAFAEGVGRAFTTLMMPVTGIQVSVQNGYVYLGRTPFSLDPQVMEARMLDMQRVTMELAPTVLHDWRETYEPKVLEKVARILAFDYEGSSATEIAQFVRERRADLVDVWDIHMLVNIPPMGASFALEEMLTEALGEAAVAESRLLQQGFDNKSVQLGRALWGMSRWVRADAAFAETVLAARVRNGAVEVGAGARADEFGARWDAFLDAFGWRSDRFFEIGHKSWREDPSTPLTQLKGYVRMEDAQDPFAGHARQAEERDSRAAQLEARLPEELRPMFRGILPMVQQYIPIAEDHNFTIDQKFTTVMRHAVLQLGKQLVKDGALRDAEDVFYLTFDEVCGIADGAAAADFDASIRSRRREHARQATLRAPVLLGQPPSPDDPPDPLAVKFFGIGLVPSEDASIVTGHACSAGVVTGIAKVVLTLDEADKLDPGDVLVCRMTMPAWTPLFGIASAVVADSGGPLSHCAIVAREYMIPCVAGTVNGTTTLRDGMRVRVDGGTGIVTVLSDKNRG